MFKNPLFRSAYVTMVLMAICVAVFVLQTLMGVNPMGPKTLDLIRWGANLPPLTLSGDYWRLLTSMFLHIGLLHIALNMYMLYAVGPIVERTFGSLQFAVIYLLSGLFGSLASALWNGANIMVSAGASGALMGITGAFLGRWLITRGRQGGEPMGMYSAFAQTVGLNLLMGFSMKGIDNAAHIGGLLAGFVLGAAFSYGALRTRANTLALVLGLSAAGLVALWLLLQMGQTPQLLEMGQQIRQELAAPAIQRLLND